MRTLMRTSLRLLAIAAVLGLTGLWACSVPDKQPLTGDGGVDAMDQDPVGVPETRITSAPEEFSNAPAATFEFESSKPGARFECSFNGEAPTACNSPFSRSLPDGTHSFSVRAISASGERDDSPAEHLWLIDTVAPVTTITEAPPVADNSTMIRFWFISNEMNVAFECAVDGGPFEECEPNDEFGPVGDGAHSFSVRARDRAGNIDPSPSIHAWSVDTSTPDTTLLSGPMMASSSASASFTFLSPDAGPGATFQCSLDGSPFASCTSPAEYGNLAMGVHTFAVRVRDATGNVDPTPATRTWSVDLTAPDTTITDGPSGTTAMASGSISFTSNEADITFACSLDSGPFTACTSPFNAMMLPQGAHTFSVRATDVAGHTDASPATVTWTVDTVTPALAFTQGPGEGETVGPRVVFAWTASEGTVECRLGEGAWGACTSPYAFNSAAGTLSFQLRSTDAAANTTTVTRSFEIACAPPNATDAVGVFHFDTASQVQENATGGVAATLGPTDQAETSDPTAGAGRFGGGLGFNSGEGDLVAWPAAMSTAGTFSFEIWSRPDGAAGDIVSSGDNRFALRVMPGNGNTVRFTATAVDSGGASLTVTSGAYAAGTWRHVVVALSEPTLRLWVDGDRVENTNVRLGMSVTLDNVLLGSNYAGFVDELWVSDGALVSDDSVLARYCPVSGIRI